MPLTIVNVEGFGEVVFPDGMSEEEIQSVIRRKFNEEPEAIGPSPEKAALLEEQQKLLSGETAERPDYTLGEGLQAGVYRGVKGLEQAGAGLGALLVDQVAKPYPDFIEQPLRQVSDAWMQHAQKVGEEIQAVPPEVPSFTDIGGPKDAAVYAAENLAQQLPNLVATFIPGIKGAQLAQRSAQAAAVGLSKEAAKKLIERKVLTAGAASAVPVTAGIESGTIYSDIAEKTGQRAPGTALTAGVVAGGLEAIPTLFALRRLFGRPVSEKITKGLLSRVGKAGAEQILSEGLTEGAQTWIERRAVEFIDPQQKTMSPQGVEEIINSMIAGAVVGTAVGGTVGAVDAYQNRGQKPPSVDPAAFKAEADIVQQQIEQGKLVPDFRASGPAATPLPSDKLPHALSFVGRPIEANGNPIGRIVGVDQTGLIVMYNGQLQPSVLPYQSVGLAPGVNVRVPGMAPVAPQPQPEAEPLTEAEVAELIEQYAPEPPPPAAPAAPAEPPAAPVTPVTETAPAVTPTQPERPDASQVVGAPPRPLPDWIKERLKEREAQGWNNKWPFVPADLLNKSFRDAILSDPTLSLDEKKKIMSFGPPEAKGEIDNYAASQQSPAPMDEGQPPADGGTVGQGDAGTAPIAGTSEEAPGPADVRQEIEEAAAEAELNPTEAQKEAGNYRKGHVTIDGLDISIENAKGSTRSGFGKDGKPWSVVMPAHYGYVKGTVGKDKDHVDIYIGENPGAPQVWVIDQRDLETLKFDEHKAMVGFQSAQEALDTYHAAFQDWQGGKGPSRFMGMKEMTKEEFKNWLERGDKGKPVTSQTRSKIESTSTPPKKVGLRPRSPKPPTSPDVSGVAPPITEDSRLTLMGIPVTLSESTTVDTVEYGLFKSTYDDQGVILVRDTESGNVVTLKSHPTFAAAKQEFDSTIEAAKRTTAPPVATPAEEAATTPPEGSLQTRAVEAIQARIAAGETLDRNTAHDIVAGIYGGTIGQGIFTAKDLSDVIELAINRHILATKAGDRPFWDIQDDASGAAETVKSLKALLDRIPTQTVRTAETDRLQQFSTPPPLAYVANWVANLQPGDVVIEPSAGVGGLAVFPKTIGATVVANELSDRRRSMLRKEVSGIPDHLFGDNAEHLNALMRPRVESGEIPQPTVVVMNPPFSNAANTSRSNTLVGAKHVEEALNLLPQGGRLVAIVGRGMAHDAAMFEPWWRKIAQKYNVRANIGIEGTEYRKYGTSFGNQLLVIDKTGPLNSWADVVLGQVDTIEQLVPLLERVRNDRPSVSRPTEQPPTEPSRPPEAPPGAATVGRPENVSPGPVPTGPAGERGDAAQPETGAGPVREPNQPAKRPPGLRGRPAPERPAATPAPGPVEPVPPVSETVEQVEVTRQEEKETLKEMGVFTEYKPRKVKVKGAQPHPAALVESTAMAAVEPVDPNYKPKIPQKNIDSGYPSLVQLENVIYAGQAHSVTLPDGQRMGYFIGDGCVAAGTQIYDPVKNSSCAIEVLMQRGKDHTVLALTSDGFRSVTARCPFLKGVDDLYEVTLASGRAITVTRDHRFLGESGWKHLRSMAVGDLIAVQSGQSSDSEHGNDALKESAPNCWCKPQDCLGDYRPYPSCDAPPLTATKTDRVFSPSQGDVLERNQISSHEDDAGLSLRRNRPHPLIFRHAKSSSFPEAILGPSLISSQAFSGGAEWSPLKRQSAPRFPGATVDLRCLVGPVQKGQLGSFASDLLRSACGEVSSACRERRTPLGALRSTVSRFERQSLPRGNYLPLPGNQSPESSCASFAQLFSSRWDRIVSIQFVKREAFYDMYVPGPENYVANGIVNHNTGVGKGVQIASIILDNWNQGRRKALWVSASEGLLADAKRDLADVGFDLNKVIDLRPNKGRALVGKTEGVAFVPYSSLIQHNPGLDPKTGELIAPTKDKSRIHLLNDWLGKDFDGVIVFDEAHKAGNAITLKGVRGVKDPSQTGLTVVQLQKMFPNARVVYASATGATDVTNLSYADRLGIWGPETPFPNKENFFNEIKSGGLSAMEIVARDLKSMGRYLARTISFEGVTKEQVVHKLTPEQVTLYNELSRGWQSVLAEMNEIMANSGAARNTQARKNAAAAFYGAQQRFYNQLLTALQMPSVLAKMRQSLDAGHAVVLQLVNTNEAAQERAIADKSAAANDAEGDAQNYLEDLDLSPKQILIDFIEKKLPVSLYEPIEDEEGNTQWKPVLDANGNPVKDPAAVEKQQEMLDRIRLLKAPQNPLDMILNTFGADNVAEITGRDTRIVEKLQADGTKKLVTESGRNLSHRKTEAKAFEDDQRRILIFSGAANTGYTFSASKKFKNQRQRDHILLQAGWVADAAMQGFGRTHRSNQAQPPHYVLVSTDIKGHQRFISTIARRLQELGALTGGERKASSQFFDETSNLENKYAEAAVTKLFTDLYAGAIPGMDFGDLTSKMGYTRTTINERTGEKETINTLINPKTGGLNVAKIPDVPIFLNRILALEVDQQNSVFDAFMERMQNGIERAKEDGSYDPGTQTLKAKSIRKVSDRTVYEHPGSTAKTRLVEIDYDLPVEIMSWGKVNSGAPVAGYAKNRRSGRIYAIKEGPPRTLQSGAVVDTYRRIGPTGHEIVPRSEISKDNYERLDRDDAEKLWESEVAKAPKIRTHRDTYVVGAFLPIWDRLKIPDPKIWRITIDGGETFLGAHVPPGLINDVRARLNADAGAAMTPEQVFSAVFDRNQRFELANGWKLFRARVGGENRIEVSGLNYDEGKEFTDKMGGFMERIQYQPRFFVPTDPAQGQAVIQKILRKSPILQNPQYSITDWTEVGPTGEFLSVEQVQEAIKDEPKLENVEVEVVSRPDRTDIAGVFFYTASGKGGIFLNAAALQSPEAARQTLREEIGHALLSSPDGRKAVLQFANELMTDAEREALNRGLYQQQPGETDAAYNERLANEFIAKAGVKKSGFWRTLIEKVKAWFASKGWGQLTNEETARAILRRLAAMVQEGTLTPGSLPREAEKYSFNPATSATDVASRLAGSPLLRPPDALWNAQALYGHNAVFLDPVRAQFEALPEAVRKALPNIQGRLDAMDAAQENADQVSGSPVQIPGGDVQQVAKALSQHPWDQHSFLTYSLYNALNLVEETKRHGAETVKAAAESKRARQEVPAKRMEALVGEVIDFRRGVLTAQRSAADKAGDTNARDAAINALTAWSNVRVAVQNVLNAMVAAIPETALQGNPAPSAVLAAWQAAKPANIGATPEMIAAVEGTLAEMPDIGEQLLGIKKPEHNKAVRLLEERADAMRQGLKFIQDLTKSPEFTRNYQDAIEAVDANAVVLHQNKQGNPVFVNPLDPSKRVELRRDFTEEGYRHDRDALDVAQGWFEKYLDPTVNPNIDPIRAVSYEQLLQQINDYWRTQLWNPKTGKLLTGGMNPFDWVATHVPVARIPDYLAQSAGGSISSWASWSLANYSEFLRASQVAHNKTSVKASQPTQKAFEAADMDVDTWSRMVGDEILAGYQVFGGQRKRVGDYVRGHKITTADMDALRAQKRYVDAQREAGQYTLTFPTAAGQALKIRDVIGDTTIERAPTPVSEHMMPRRLAKNTATFVKEWQEIARNTQLDQAAKNDLFEDLLNTSYLDQGLISHFRTFLSNPEYAADIDSPFKAEYQQLALDHDVSGRTPIDSLDALVDHLFASQRNLPPDQQMAKDEIRDQVLSEINGAVSRFADDETTHLADPDRTRVNVTSAENFMNRPRGRQLLPNGFYTYTVATEDEQASIRGQIGEVFAQRFVNELQSLVQALGEQVRKWEGQLNFDPAQARAEQIAGETFLNYNEAKRLEAVIGTMLQDLKAYVDGGRAYDFWLMQPLSVARSAVSNAVLQRPGTLLQNWLGTPFKKAWLEMTMLRSGHNLLLRNPVIGGVYYSGKEIISHGLRTVNNIIGGIVNQPEVTPRMKQVADYLSQNKAYWSRFAGLFADYLMRQQGRVAELTAIGIKDEDPIRQNIAALLAHPWSGGRLRGGKQTLGKRAGGILKTAVLMANEIGLPFQLPRVLGVPGVETLNNMVADKMVDQMLGSIFMFSKRALDGRAALGYDPTQTLLTPEEVFGRKDAKASDLAQLRAFFDREAINLDRLLIEFWQSRQNPNTPPQTLREYLTPAKYKALVRQMAGYTNKAGFSNRPFFTSQPIRTMMMFFGWAANDNAQIARSMAAYSRDPRSPLWRSKDLFVETASLIMLMSVFGFLYQPAREWLHRFFFNEESPLRKLWDAKSVKEALLINLQNMAGSMPILGRLIVNALGAATPGTRWSAFGIQLFPLSAFDNITRAVSKAIQTGDWDRALVELTRQFVPNSRVILNRMGMREGITTETAVRNLLAANAPTGVEVKQGGFPTGQIQYSPARAYTDNVVNALSSETTDMEYVRKQRDLGIQALVDGGKSPQDAAEAFDRSVMARNPFVAVYGRDLTQAEMAELRESMGPDELERLDRLIQGRHAYAREFGRTEPDYLRDVEPVRGGGRTPMFRPVGLRRRGVGGFGRVSNPLAASNRLTGPGPTTATGRVTGLRALRARAPRGGLRRRGLRGLRSRRGRLASLRRKGFRNSRRIRLKRV